MDPHLRQVTQIPLQELWRPAGSLICTRIRSLNNFEIAELLRAGVIEFVVADVGKPLEWINPQDCFNFWKSEVKSHIVEADSRIELDAYPSGYCYLASRWKGEDLAPPLVLLEKHH